MTEPYYADDAVTLYAGDCLDVLATLPACSVDAVVTDPPYGLEFMGKDWDAPWQKGAGTGGHNAGFDQTGLTDGYKRLPRPSFTGATNPGCLNCGGKKHGNDPKQRKVCTCDSPRFQNFTLPRMVAFQQWCQLWAAECLRVLKPGGHLLAFGGTRTWHRLVCAIEDAGFEVRDSIAWLMGSGFPKSLNVGRAIDLGFCRAAGTHINSPDHICPETPEGDVWRGHGSALKPAHEPIVVARKPLTGTVAANVLAHGGTGALNIDGCRIGSGGQLQWAQPRDMGYHGGSDAGSVEALANSAGRWPANVALDEAAAAALDHMSGELHSQDPATRGNGNTRRPGGMFGEPDPYVGYADTGGASRFFYTAKAGSDERITHDGVSHPTVKPLALMRWLVRLVTPPGGVILEPFAGSGTTVEAAILEGFRCIAIEREPDYLPLITQRLNRRRDPLAYLTAAGEDLGIFDFEEPA